MTAAVHLNELGIVCALGAGKDTVANRLFGGVTGVVRQDGAVTDGTSLPCAPVTVPLPETPTLLARFASRNLSLVLKALEEIHASCAAAVARFGPDRVAVVMGSSTSGISEGERALSNLDVTRTLQLPEGFDFLPQEMGSVAESIAALYALETPAITISTACSSSAKALATGRRLIRQGLADAVIAGGCDSKCGLTLNGFHSLSALTTTSCLPFSANRNGTMIGEGAAIFLMGRERTGAQLCGIGESSDAHNMTAPEPGGTGASNAMMTALTDGGISAAQVDYINLHGTATDLNDAMESRAVRSVFPENVPCSSSKAQIGHTLGAAGAIETAICWLTMCANPESKLPPHVWDGVPDPAAALPGLVTPTARLADRARRYLMSNSYAFGGSNVSLLLGSIDD